MNKIGFIGYGSMGSIMLKALLDAFAVRQEEVIVTTRTKSKLHDFKKHYPNVEIVSTVAELGSKCHRVFICTGTMEVKGVLSELVQYLPPDAHIIIITGNIEIQSIERIFHGSITKIMPNQLSEIREGVSLVCHNEKVLLRDREFIKSAFELIGKVKEVNETQFALGADLCSCAPAFFASILRSLTEAAKHHGSLTEAEVKEMIVWTCYGTARLIVENNTSFADLISRVATKGGISEEGVKVLDGSLPRVFDDLLNITLTKHESVRRRIQEQYSQL
jgi:pyrroline-5-carboxylate reductase